MRVVKDESVINALRANPALLLQALRDTAIAEGALQHVQIGIPAAAPVESNPAGFVKDLVAELGDKAPIVTNATWGRRRIVSRIFKLARRDGSASYLSTLQHTVEYTIENISHGWKLVIKASGKVIWEGVILREDIVTEQQRFRFLFPREYKPSRQQAAKR